MPFIGNKPSAVPLTSADIADGIITNADIANSTINLTTKVTGTLPVANGGTGLAALGTSLQVLRTNSGATALEFASASSDYVLLATTDASSSASVSFDGYFSATYKNYKVIFANIIPSSNGNEAFKIRYRRSNADVTASNYKAIGTWNSVNSAGGFTDSYSAVNNDSSCALATASTTASGYGLSGDLILYDPLNTTQYKIFISQTLSSDTQATPEMVHHKKGGYLLDSQNALSGISFFFNSGNITSGNFKLYGIK